MDAIEVTRVGPLYLKSPAGEGLVTFDLFKEDGRLVCCINQLEARFKRTRSWLTTIRGEMRKMEQIAKDAGCVEMRLSGRDWSRCFPDYEYLMGVPNGLRKEL